MSRIVSRAEGFERVYEAFDAINFAAFDYDTVKQSLLEYIKLTFPESFNDFIESSELIAIVETFAYVAEVLAYRIDVAAHENFISTAQRKDSVLRLAKLISYSSSRPIPSRGLVKITSVSTTETLVDANGTQLTGRAIRWNDPSNPSWKEQFMLIMNRVLDQEVGNVSPTDRFQLQDVLFEIYSFRNNPIDRGVFTYTVTANGRPLPMELVPVEYDETVGIVERRPRNNSNFTLLYGSDGVGDGSPTSGFFCFTKQGSLEKISAVFDGITPSQKFTVPVVNVNDTDVWVNQIDPNTGAILDEPAFTVVPTRDKGVTGEWVQVDIAHAQNITFNTNPRRNKYEVETVDNNQIRLIFGDGEFATIPGGSFDIWVRSSVDGDVVIPQNSVVDKLSSFTYVDTFNQTQTCTFTYSLINTLQNGSAAETMEQVRAVAPAVYYTQDRMVNDKDYNVFMLQDPSIAKMRAVNRTFAGDSKYIPWYDASTHYENVKIFGNDAFLYFDDQPITATSNLPTTSALIDTAIEPLLSSTDIFVKLVSNGVPPSQIRRYFTPQEKQSIAAAIEDAGDPAAVSLFYRKTDGTWFAIEGVDDGSAPGTDPAEDLKEGAINLAGDLTTDFWPADPAEPNPFITEALIYFKQKQAGSSIYDISRRARRLIVDSPTTKFWSTNEDRVINYDSIRSEQDKVVILQANSTGSRDGLLMQNWGMDVLFNDTIRSGTEYGLQSIHRLVVVPSDGNGDRIPDDVSITYPAVRGLADIMISKVRSTLQSGAVDVEVTLPVPYISTFIDQDIRLYDASTGEEIAPDTVVMTPEVIGVNNKVLLTNVSGSDIDVDIVVTEYVYLHRMTVNDDFVPVSTSINSASEYHIEHGASTPDMASAQWIRRIGRDKLNFMWTHTTPRYYLTDPTPTNIIDMFIITKGYYNEIRRWIQDPTSPVPTKPTPLDLRTSYAKLLENKMISDSVILHAGQFKILFGDKAAPEMRGMLKVVRSENGVLTDNQVKTMVVATVRNFFDISKWEFGETFYVTELLAAVHNALRSEISSIVIVPGVEGSQFGNLFQVECREDEMFYPDINVEDVEVVSAFTPVNLRMNP